MICFKYEDIKDKALLSKLIKEEADRIFNSSIARRHRSYDIISNNVKLGKTAEVWLYENFNYKFTNDIYTDLLTDRGNIIEVKVKRIKNLNCLNDQIQNDLEKIKSSNVNNSTVYICFSYNDNIYKLEKIIKLT